MIVKKSSLNGKIFAPPSKSHTHRAYLLAALSDGESEIFSPLFGEDTNATLEAVEAFGAGVFKENGNVRIIGGNLHTPEKMIDCKNSGSSIRMLAGISARLNGTTSFTGDETLCRRPMNPLLNALKDLGCEVVSENGFAPFSIKGPASGTEVSIRGDVSSQFISSLLISAPLGEKSLKITLTSELTSRPYVEMTIQAMQKHGVFVEPTENGFFLEAGQKYKPVDTHVEGDYSSASFILAGAALTGEVTVTGLTLSDPQGDKVIIEILKKLGADVSVNGDSVTVKKSELKGCDINLADAPDLFPITAVLCAAAEGRSRLYGASHLAFKESNRILTTVEFLKTMGADIEATNDGCIISGGKLHGGKIITYKDHRIAMASAIAALIAESDTIIDDMACADVSYPQFVSDIRKLGGVII